MAKQKKITQFAILGLGRFGMSIVQTLAQHDVNILACDRDAAKVHAATEYATQAIQMDMADESAMKTLGLGNYDVVILAMGEDFEASLIATMVAKEQGAQYVMVKAQGLRQKRILKNIGADQVVLPEHETGEKIARQLVGSNIMDILEESELYVISEMRPLEEWIGKTVRQADIRRKHGLMILAARRGDKLSIPISPDRVLTEEDVLITLEERKPHK